MPSQVSAINAAATASAAAVHITRRYASTTATDATSEADMPPNANPSAATATRPPSRAAALFTLDAEPPRSQGAASKTTVVSGATHAVMPIPVNTRPVGAHDTEHNNAVALADYLAAH